MFIIKLLTKETDFYMSKMKSTLHHYQFYDLNDLQMKKSKYVILSVASRSEEDLSFSFSFDCIEILCVESFFQHEVVNIFSTLVRVVEFVSYSLFAHFDLHLHLCWFSYRRCLYSLDRVFKTARLWEIYSYSFKCMLVVSADLWMYIMKLTCFTTWLLCTCTYIWVISMKLMTKDTSMCFWLYFITSLMFKSSLVVKESVVEENDSLKLIVLSTLRTSRVIIKTLRQASLQSFCFFVINCSLLSSDEILNEVKLSVLLTALLKHCMKFSCSLLLCFSIAWIQKM